MIPDEIRETGRANIQATQDDPTSSAVAKMAEDMLGEMMAMGATPHTMITILTSAIGYAIGNGARMNGAAIEGLAGSLGVASSVLMFSAFDAFERADVRTIN